jgi:hypothetical protein
MDPVVFRGNAGKLGLYDAEVLIAATQFYFRLDAVAQAIQSVATVCARREERSEPRWDKLRDEERAKFIAERLQSCFKPALKAIQGLGVPEAGAFDQEVTQVYPHLRDSGFSLRDALRNHNPT